MNLPNKLTLLRILLIPVFIITMMFDFSNHYLLSSCRKCVIFCFVFLDNSILPRDVYGQNALVKYT